MSVYYYMFGMKCHWQFPSAPAGPAPEFMTTQVGSTDGGNAPHDANYTSNVLKEDEHVTRVRVQYGNQAEHAAGAPTILSLGF